MQTEAPEIRSIEDSLSHANDASYRAAHLVELIWGDLNGSSPEVSQAINGGGPSGVIYSADYLAGRLESLCTELQRVRSRIVSNKPSNLAVSADYAKGQAIGVGRAGYTG